MSCWRRKHLRACSFPGDPRYAMMTLTGIRMFGGKGIFDFLCSGQHFAVNSIAKGCI